MEKSVTDLKLTGKHILLLLLYVPGETSKHNEPIEGRTRIIKMMFLFDKEIKKTFLKDSDLKIIKFPEFFPWYYGPFSKDIYNDIEFFISNGFVESSLLESEMTDIELDEFKDWLEDYLFDEEKKLFSNDRNQEQFRLKETGVKFIEEKILDRLSENQKEILKKFKKNLTKASIRAIVRYAYIRYPEYSKKSKIKDSIFDK